MALTSVTSTYTAPKPTNIYQTPVVQLPTTPTASPVSTPSPIAQSTQTAQTTGANQAGINAFNQSLQSKNINTAPTQQGSNTAFQSAYNNYSAPTQNNTQSTPNYSAPAIQSNYSAPATPTYGSLGTSPQNSLGGAGSTQGYGSYAKPTNIYGNQPGNTALNSYTQTPQQIEEAKRFNTQPDFAATLAELKTNQQNFTDALNNRRAQMLEQARINQANAVGGNSAIFARSGQAGSPQANAAEAGLQASANIQNQGINGQFDQDIINQNTALNNQATNQFSTLANAQHTQANDYLNYVNNLRTQQQTSAQSAVSGALAQDPNAITNLAQNNPQQLEQIAQTYGLHAQDLQNIAYQTTASRAAASQELKKNSYIPAGYGGLVDINNPTSGAIGGANTPEIVTSQAQDVLNGFDINKVPARSRGLVEQKVKELLQGSNVSYADIQAQNKYYNSAGTQSILTNSGVVISTLDLLKQSANAVNNGNNVLANELINKAKYNFQSNPDVADYNVLASIGGDELGKILGSGQGSDFATNLGLSLTPKNLSNTSTQKVLDTAIGRVHNKVQEVYKRSGRDSDGNFIPLDQRGGKAYSQNSNTQSNSNPTGGSTFGSFF